jgi:cyclic pyranopterin phosphate synthase
VPEYTDSLDKSKEAILYGASPRRWICEVHREIYDFIENNTDGDLKGKGLDLVAEAFWYGKKMADRLVELNDDVENAPRNPDFDDDLERRSSRLNLLKDIWSVNIDTMDWCNRKCDWCPNKDRKTSPDNLMKDEVLVRILKQLLDHSYRGEIHPFLNGEPSLDKRMPDIVRIIKRVLPKSFVKIVTSGDGLRTAFDLDLYFAAGVDSIHMNHYDGRFAHIKKARDHQYEKLSHFGLAHLTPTFYNRAGKVDYTPRKKVEQCDWFLHKLVFNYKGDMILCCSDFNSEVVFGNIMDQPLSMIMQSDLYKKYKRAHKDKNIGDLPLCKDCNRIA